MTIRELNHSYVLAADEVGRHGIIRFETLGLTPDNPDQVAAWRAANGVPRVTDTPAGLEACAAALAVIETFEEEKLLDRSKAVGEPPFMLGISVFEAIGHAVASVADASEERP